jgi:hypothetical protein
MSKNYNIVSGLVFGFVAVVHAARAAMHVPVTIGSNDLPVWLSWLAFLVASSLSVWAFRSRGQRL